MLNIKKEEQIVERELLTEGEKIIIANEYFDVDSTEINLLIERKVDSLQYFILYLIAKYPNLANRLNWNIVNSIINYLESEYDEAVVETDDIYKTTNIKPISAEELEEKLVTDKSKKYFPSMIERHKGFEEYVKKFAEQESVESIEK